MDVRWILIIVITVLFITLLWAQQLPDDKKNIASHIVEISASDEWPKIQALLNDSEDLGEYESLNFVGELLFYVNGDKDGGDDWLEGYSIDNLKDIRGRMNLFVREMARDEPFSYGWRERDVHDTAYVTSAS